MSDVSENAQSDSKPFVHLHVHTEFSLLDGLSKIDKLVARAKAQGMTSLAITDHGTMHGVMQFFRACRTAEIKPIIGMESYLAKRDRNIHDQTEKQPYHLLLLAKNKTGYLNLLKLASEAQLTGFYGKPRVDKDLLAKYSEGIICTSGCLAGEIPRMFAEDREADAKRLIGEYQDIFGVENFFLELQAHDIPELRTLNEWLIRYRGGANVPLLATNDVHYVMADDFDAHDTLLCIQTGARKDEVKRMRMTDPSYHLRSSDEMWALFGDVAPEALTHTQLVADMCDLELESKGYHLPIFPVPEVHTAGSYLRQLALRGARWRYGDEVETEVVSTRIEYELGIINKMGFETYFLIVWDLCQYARNAGIWWNVRGSGAGSVVAYSLGITSIDPIRNNLIFERFLNPGRVTMPDIDMDFPDDQRARMIDYTVRKYGEDKVAAIITFGTLKARAAIKDVARTLAYPLDRANALTQMVPNIPSHPVTLAQCLGDDPEYMVADLKNAYSADQETRNVLDTAIRVEGVARSAGTHAAGVIIGDQPLVQYLPLHRPTSNASEAVPIKRVTQFPMEVCESIGLLKIDFLGLSTLSVMRRACELIERYHGIRYDLGNIPYRPVPADLVISKKVEESFDLIGSGEVTGVFQLESQGMRRMLVEMKPRTFEHIVAAISLYRPGPLQFIPLFNKRLHGEEPVEYLHPKLEPILAETYGICVSGDSLVINAHTGQRSRVDELAVLQPSDFYIQGIDADHRPAVGLVTHWLDNGVKPIYRVTLPNGAMIKATAEHQFLTEHGWRQLKNLRFGDFIATPQQLVEPDQPMAIEREKLRVLAYLIADGSLASGSAVDFVNKSPLMLAEYVRCLEVFSDVKPVYINQIHDVTRVGIRQRGKYRQPTSLLCWLRELGLKYETQARVHPLGVRNHEKSIPAFVFSLSNDDLAYFVASLWDCDGYVDSGLCHYKTISEQLAYDVQTLLLRLGITSTIYRANYESTRGTRTAFQVSLYDTEQFIALVSPHLITKKAEVVCTGSSFGTTIDRNDFIVEVRATTNLSGRALMAEYGIDRQHFLPKRSGDLRIGQRIVRQISEILPLPRTLSYLNCDWQPISAIEPVGEERVFDLTVEGIHSFVANNIIVHNCVYQEQIQRIGADLFGYSLGDADLMRRAVSKKKIKDLIKHKEVFIAKGPENGVSPDVAEKIFDQVEFFAAYGFNKSHAADYAVITCQTAFLKCHYAPEYYTALLTVQRDKIEDVTLFTADCRRLGIPILPPNINYSELDFTIEEQNGKRGIRFGLGAIKGVGDKVSEMVISERIANGPYLSLSDFSSRLDLGALGGKRPLEALTKVGVFDAFGERHLILAALERMTGMSKAQHHARKTGQSLMFDSIVDDSQTDAELLKGLPNVQTVTQREKLDWEKELIGLYVSSHPLDPFVALVKDLPNLTFSSQMKEEAETIHDRAVTMVGMASAIRRVITKKNDTMAIVTVDDLFGSFDAVFFPRTWARFADTIKENEPYIFRGKADTKRGSPQVLVDSITQEFGLSRSADDDDPYFYDTNPPPYATSPGNSKVSATANLPPSYEAYESQQNVGNRSEEPKPASRNNASGDHVGNGNVNENGTNVQVVVSPPPIADWHDDDEDRPPPPCQLLVAFAPLNSGKREAWQRRIERIYLGLSELPGNDELTFRIPDPDTGIPQLMTFGIGINYDLAVSYLEHMKVSDKAEISWTDLKN